MSENKHIEAAKRRVGMLAGRNIILKVNKGRNKFVRYNGVIRDVYPAIFTVSSDYEGEEKIYSYSYNDVLTKIVRFYPAQEKTAE